MKNGDLEEIQPRRPGDKVLRRTVKRQFGLRRVPEMPALFRVLREILTRTPFAPMFLTLVVLWLLFALGMYLIERNANGADMTTYGEALWWALASVETMDTPYEPATDGGRILGGIWAVLGVMVFWGTIIASVTVYFTNRRNSQSSRLMQTIHYGLDELGKLALDELDTLKYTTNKIIDEQIEKVKHFEEQKYKIKNR